MGEPSALTALFEILLLLLILSLWNDVPVTLIIMFVLKDSLGAVDVVGLDEDLLDLVMAH